MAKKPHKFQKMTTDEFAARVLARLNTDGPLTSQAIAKPFGYDSTNSDAGGCGSRLLRLQKRGLIRRFLCPHIGAGMTKRRLISKERVVEASEYNYGPSGRHRWWSAGQTIPARYTEPYTITPKMKNLWALPFPERERREREDWSRTLDYAAKNNDPMPFALYADVLEGWGHMTEATVYRKYGIEGGAPKWGALWGSVPGYLEEHGWNLNTEGSYFMPVVENTDDRWLVGPPATTAIISLARYTSALGIAVPITITYWGERGVRCQNHRNKPRTTFLWDVMQISRYPSLRSQSVHP